MHATTSTNLENSMLSGRRQTQKGTYAMIPFLWNVQSQQIHRDRKYISGCQGQGRGQDKGDYFMGKGFIWGDEMFWN